MKPLTVKSIIDRTVPPSLPPMFWSRLPGQVVDKFSGQKLQILNENNPNVWAQNLLSIIKDQSNQLHRKSMLKPANFIVCNGFGFILIKSLLPYKPLMLEKNNYIFGVDFIDAHQVGKLDDRWVVLVSDSIVENKILLGVPGNGLDFKGRVGASDIPEIDVILTENPYHQIGQVAYWSYIEILDINL